MSQGQQALIPQNDGSRYVVEVSEHVRKDGYVVYCGFVTDLVFRKFYKLFFRYSQLKKFHQDFEQVVTDRKLILPPFPGSRSYKFWKATNKCDQLINNRKRQLAFYLSRIVNDGALSQLAPVKKLFATMQEEQKRSGHLSLVCDARATNTTLRHKSMSSRLTKCSLSAYQLSNLLGK